MKKFLQFLICLILFNKAFLVIGQTWNIKVIFPYFKDSVSDVRVCYGNKWESNGEIMTKQSDGSYKYTINDNVSKSLLFDIYYIPPVNSCLSVDYLPGINGIQYSHVYVNDTMLNNSFLVFGNWTSTDGCQRNKNFKVDQTSDGSITPDYTAVDRAFIDQRVQPEVPFSNYCNHNTIPNTSTHKCIKPWFQVLHDYRYPDSVSKIEVDYFELYYRIGNENKLMIREDYSDGFDQTSEGGLYSRYPFLSSCNDGHTQMPANCPNGVLTFYPSDNKNKLYHFWLQPGINRVSNDRYYLIAKLKITGPASIQAGIDFTPDGTSAINHIELGASNWYFESSDWQYLIFDSENNLPININAGGDQSVNEGTTVTLDGSTSSDPDGNPLTYKWTAPAGISLSSATAAKPTFTAPEVKKDSTLTFSLVVNNGTSDSAPAIVKVTVLNVINVGVSTLNSPFIKIYPNPTTGIATVEISGGTGRKTGVLVTSLVGSEIFRKEIVDAVKFQIDLSNQIGGVYLLKIKTDNRRYISKIIVSRQK